MLNILKNYMNFIMFYHFFPKEWKLKNWKACRLHEKNWICYTHKKLNQAINHGLVLKKVQRVSKLNQDPWLKPYIDINTDLKKKMKNDFKKDFFKLINNAVFGKTMGNVRKHRDIKFATTKGRRNYFVWELNYHTTKFFTESLLVIGMKRKTKKTEIPMSKPVYLGLSLLKLSKILMYKFGMII